MVYLYRSYSLEYNDTLLVVFIKKFSIWKWNFVESCTVQKVNGNVVKKKLVISFDEFLS